MTKIEWVRSADGTQGKTWNPLAGCSVKSTGCKHCYAMPMAARLEKMGQELYKGLTTPSNAGPVFNGTVRQAGDHVLLAPLKRKKPTMYFVNSMSDLFHENVPDEWIDRIFAVMALSPQHTFQVLTKRAIRMRDFISAQGRFDFVLHQRQHIAEPWNWDTTQFRWPLPNVWLGVSAERQQEADERIPILYQTPAAIRFASFEPLLGRIKIPPKMKLQDGGIVVPVGLNWAIAGAESGPGARDCEEGWVRYLRDQCVPAGIAFFYKQHAIKGKKIPTPELDGRRWVEMPRLREAATPGAAK